MQVDPIKPTLKAPGLKLLILEYGKPLSNFGFKFNLRRHSTAAAAALQVQREDDAAAAHAEVGRCSLTLSNPR